MEFSREDVKAATGDRQRWRQRVAAAACSRSRKHRPT